MLAGGGDAEADPPGQRADIGGLVRRGALPSSANVAAADCSWGWVGSVPSRESGSPGGVDSFSIERYSKPHVIEKKKSARAASNASG